MSSYSESIEFITFFIELPDPIGIPHDTTISIDLEIIAPELIGMFRALKDGQPLIPDSDQGQLFASFRFWQKEVQMPSMISETVEGVMKTILPPGVHDSVDRRSRELPPVTSAVTAVDAATPLLKSDGSEAIDLAFNRCFDNLNDIVRAYRISTGDDVRPLTKERLSITIPYSIRQYLGNGQTEAKPPSLLMMHLNLPMRGIPRFLERDEVTKLLTFRHRIVHQDPLLSFLDFSIEAHRLCARDGDFTTSVLYAYMASEVLLDTILKLLLWEKNASPVDTARTVFNLGLANRVVSTYPQLLGGQWVTKGRGPVADWARNLGDVRHKIVHGGYRPTREETAEALNALESIAEHVRSRLIARCKTYRKTTLLFLGEPGLRKRNAWSLQIEEYADAHFDAAGWLSDYRLWSEAMKSARV